MSESLKVKAEKLEKFKYPLVVLVIGVALMLLPTGSSQMKESTDRNEQVALILSQTEGVGEARVLWSPVRGLRTPG